MIRSRDLRHIEAERGRILLQLESSRDNNVYLSTMSASQFVRSTMNQAEKCATLQAHAL